LTADTLAPLRRLRPAHSDKRSFGHAMIVGGSRGYPGAVIMAVHAALRSGAGLVTAFVPESLSAACAARLPEAMWVGWPETPEGGLALEGLHLWHERGERASALVIGPGLGRSREPLTLVTELIKGSAVPLVLDADALQSTVVDAIGGRAAVLTPHAGEFERIAGGADLSRYAAKTGATIVLKGPLTTVAGGANAGVRYHAPFGGPVLARGGSGDLLAGLIGGLLAQDPGDPFGAACRGVVWHGAAADELARAHGQNAVQTTQLLDFLPIALRGSLA
jgi:hydroxyethylthiazole kinase-like uncharacterized protein yjeF